MKKYRFKTREEFIRDGLWDEKDNCPYYWNPDGEMNEYLGIDVPDECIVYCDKNEEFKYDGWLFQNTDYVLKEQQEYFNDLSQHIGRYIRDLIDNPHSGSKVKKGDIGKIITRCLVDFPNRKSYSCTCALSKDYLGVKYELLPEDYSPEKENKEPNIEFIPGKWYKYNGWYIKYKGHVNDIWRSSEQINYSKKYSKIESRFGERDSDDKKILLLDLSEIQEYLPDGHPDKVKNLKLEVGKWYKFLNGSFKFGKYEKIHNSGNRIKFSEIITSTGIYDNKSTHVDFTSNIEPLEDLSEIQKYLPNEHPDKITKQEFKVGKWYKWYQKNHGSFHYGKFDSITNTTILMKPCIIHCDSYSETGAFDINSVQQITEISYSEIEQFLPEDMKETKEFPKYWFVKNNKQPELLEYAGYISKESPAWWKPFPYIGYDGVYSCNGMHGCPQSSFINDAVEVSFEDFLENIYYVKFPKKRKQKSEFVLPEKWYTKPKTNEEKDVLNKFVVDLKDNHWKIEDKHSYEHTPHFKNGNYQRSTWIGYEDNDYTEITFEQFKKYVLKDKSVASTDKVKYVIATSEEAVFVSSVVESVSISILNVEDSKILPLPKSIESIKTKLN